MALSNYDPGQELSSIDFSAVIGGPLNAIVEAQSKAALSTVDFVKSVGFTPDTEDETTGAITPGKPIYVSFKYPKMVQPYQAGITGKIDQITIANKGTQYKTGDTLMITPSSGPSFSISVSQVDNSGAITSVSYDKSLSGYTNETSLSGVGGSSANQDAKFDITAVDIPPVPAVFQEMQLEVPILTMMPIPFIRVEEGEIDFHAKITSMEYKRVGSDFKVGTSLDLTNNNTNINLIAANSINYNKNENSVNLKVNVSFQRTSTEGHKIDKTYHLGVKVKVAQEEMPEGMEKLLGILEDAIVSRPIE